MGLTKIATWRNATQGMAVLLIVNEQKIEITHADLNKFDTKKKIEPELKRQAILSNVDLPAIFAHINRDGSIAIATSAAPKVWPEDDPDEA